MLALLSSGCRFLAPQGRRLADDLADSLHAWTTTTELWAREQGISFGRQLAAKKATTETAADATVVDAGSGEQGSGGHGAGKQPAHDSSAPEEPALPPPTISPAEIGPLIK